MNYKKLIATLLFGFFITAVNVAQPYAASNFSLISNINPEPGVNPSGDKYSGCWGWTGPFGQEYAIACSKNGTYWVDITNPTTPTVSAYAAGTSSNATWREVKTYQNYCYVFPDDANAAGMQIFDMSTLPASITLVSSNMNLLKRGHTAWVDGDKLYVSSVTYSDNTFSSMNVYSLATPSAPVLLRSLEQDYPNINHVHDAFVRRDTVFASCGFQGMYIYRFNTATNTFTTIGSLLSYPSSGYNHSSALTPDGKTLVFMDEVPNGLPIKVAKINSYTNIQVVSTFNQFQLTTPHNPFMYNNQYCFASSYKDGTQLWDISNPNSPYLAGYFDTFPQGGGNNNVWSGSDYDGQWGMYPYFASGSIFALDQLNGIFILKTNVFNLPEINVFSNSQPVYDGATITSTINSTGFGDVVLGGVKTNTYLITNSGPGTLSINGFSLSGPGDFSISGLPNLPLTLSTSATASFAVSFSPSITGNLTATVVIDNNDLNEGPYNFKIAGKGIVLNLVGIDKSLIDASKLLVFPNPASHEVVFYLNQETQQSDFEITISDLQGKVVCYKQRKDIFVAGQSRYSIPVSGLKEGIYYMAVSKENVEVAKTKLLITN